MIHPRAVQYIGKTGKYLQELWRIHLVHPLKCRKGQNVSIYLYFSFAQLIFQATSLVLLSSSSPLTQLSVQSAITLTKWHRRESQEKLMGA